MAAVGRLGTFAFLVEAFEDFVSLATAVLFAGAKLRRKAQVCVCEALWLLGNSTLLLVHLDHDARHRLCVSADVLDVLIGHRFRVLTEQFPTARDRNRFRPRIRMFDVLHGHPCELDADVRDALECARSASTWCRRTETMSVDVA